MNEKFSLQLILTDKQKMFENETIFECFSDHTLHLINGDSKNKKGLLQMQ